MYEPTTGRFTSLDPYFGNTNDPQSFHKYLYTHADPVNNVDPSGLMSLGNVMSAMASGASLMGRIGLTALRILSGPSTLAFLNWRFLIVAQVDDTTLNAGKGSGPLHHSAHSVQISFPAGTDMITKVNEIYADLKDFRLFNDGVNDVARVTSETIGGVRYAFFDSIGVFGLGSNVINPVKVPVRLWSDISDKTVYADTAGAHMLVGQRRWSVRLVQGTTVEIRTETYDQDRDFLNRIGVSIVRDGIGNDVQSNIWKQYLTNIVNYHSANDGAVSPQGAVVEFDEWLGDLQNPWQPIRPYLGEEVP